MDSLKTTMVFQEIKTEEGYTYKVEDIFGEIEIKSPTRLVKITKTKKGEKQDGSILDDMVVLLLRKNLGAELTTGEVVHDGGKVSYTFKRAPLWEDEDETPCKNIFTSIKERAREYTQMFLSNLPKRIVSIFSWYKRFAEAFREAWRKSK
jgi:hypothetical protein